MKNDLKSIFVSLLCILTTGMFICNVACYSFCTLRVWWNEHEGTTGYGEPFYTASQQKLDELISTNEIAKWLSQSKDTVIGQVDRAVVIIVICAIFIASNCNLVSLSRSLYKRVRRNKKHKKMQIEEDKSYKETLEIFNA